MTYFLGLDLGQANDATALAVLERIQPDWEPKPLPAWVAEAIAGGIPHTSMHGFRRVLNDFAEDPPPAHFQCRHLERLKLGTPYPAVADHVLALLDTSALRGRTQLVVDATGVGRPVVDMLRQRGLEPLAITITGGDQVGWEPGGWRVPKRDLVAVVQVLLQTERLKFAAGIPIVPVLVQELLAFRVKIDPLTAHDSYGAWREGAHDDLVLATAVASWWAERWQPPLGKYTIAKSRM